MIKLLVVCVVLLRLHFGLCEDEISQRPECLAGTLWESNCHKCRCDDGGLSHCVKIIGCDSSIEPSRCKPRTTFKQDCNTCTCVDNGLVLCTMMYCNNIPAPEKAFLHNGDQCEPGTVWKNGCNECECSDGGYAICSIEKCNSEEQASPQCKPNTTWKLDCNTCHCNERGISSCTNQECIDRDEKPSILDEEIPEVIEPRDNSLHSIKRRSVCKPNQNFKSDCNYCKCASDGRSFSCTQNECMDSGDVNKDVDVFMETEGVDHIERHSVCQPHSTFYIGCNTCYCNSYGSDYSCTNKPCPLPDDVELFHELTDMKPIIPYSEDVNMLKKHRNKDKY